MASYNRVVLVGNITRDPELRTLPSGMSVVDLGLAVNDRRKDQSGAWIEEANFFDVSVFGRSAEIVGQYTRKGSPLLVEGRLKQDVWEQDGQKRSKIKVICDRVVLLGSRDGNGGGFQQGDGGFQQGGYSQGGYSQGGGYQQGGRSRQQSQPRYSSTSQDAPSNGGYNADDAGDDIPF